MPRQFVLSLSYYAGLPFRDGLSRRGRGLKAESCENIHVLRNSRVLVELECGVQRRMDEVERLMSWEGQDERLWGNGPGNWGSKGQLFCAGSTFLEGVGGIEAIVLGYSTSI